MSTVDIAQDYLDCVAGEHGEWWKDRANEFIEGHQDESGWQLWELWAEIRRTQAAGEGEPTRTGPSPAQTPLATAREAIRNGCGVGLLTTSMLVAHIDLMESRVAKLQADCEYLSNAVLLLQMEKAGPS